MHILIGIIGIIFFLALAFLFSSDRKKYPLEICRITLSNSIDICIYFIKNKYRYHSYWWYFVWFQLFIKASC